MSQATMQEALSDLIDEMAIPKPIDWESISYEPMKNISIINTLETYSRIVGNQEMDDAQKVMSLLGIIAYLQLENAAQWIMIERYKASGTKMAS